MNNITFWISNSGRYVYIRIGAQSFWWDLHVQQLRPDIPVIMHPERDGFLDQLVKKEIYTEVSLDTAAVYLPKEIIICGIVVKDD